MHSIAEHTAPRLPLPGLVIGQCACQALTARRVNGVYQCVTCGSAVPVEVADDPTDRTRRPTKAPWTRSPWRHWQHKPDRWWYVVRWKGPCFECGALTDRRAGYGKRASRDPELVGLWQCDHCGYGERDFNGNHAHERWTAPCVDCGMICERKRGPRKAHRCPCCAFGVPSDDSYYYDIELEDIDG